MGYRKLQRTKSQRKALLRDLTTNLILNGRIQTTEARAKEVRRQAEKMITLGKRGDLAARRLAAAYLRDVEDENKIKNATSAEDVVEQKAVKTLFGDVAPRFQSRNGGYTRIYKLGQRRGDAAPMALLELVD
ncbi:50S ribosomal protein L17 [Oenococcus kitaharae]|uniref:Large ribosomal subunit protein bL17 n=1 Tax=Oenococcus kitaharae DSM 17330 TaxID=1045004 RepID=G9WFK2_9LACO|nr:50S ribosomal protein L17 [Oenococcus kitaharae]EHN59159.1 LSU ribosomal protein L17p [Oenococcus kitaharae DSM 17330]MCV3297085.1 50S ribosomal protein L17 [Oenococcus kitaharae]OEY81964.1 50S ribosomal protein L17 [Oenococcus kitaharae]OEY82335.1 50S ribosomal protein L17 [Oenococcus kitaharae]OEY82741.1 50S ribosomal protein L17 [Oenococcus kitaharae]